MASVHKRVSAATGAVAYQVRYRTPEGSLRSRTFARKTDADRFARDVEVVKDTGGFVDPRAGAITLGAWATVWLNSKANLAESTRARYADIVTAWVEPRWGSVKLANVRHDELQAWLSGIDRQPGTVRKIHRVVSQSLAYAVKSGRLARNPAEGCSLPRVHAPEKRYLTHAQVDALAAEVGPSWSLLVHFLAYTGLRWGEAAALRVGRLDLARRRVHVVESVTPVNGVMTFGAPKSHERREVPLVPFLADLLAEHVAGLPKDALVFRGPYGGVLRSSTFRARALSHAAEELGLCEPKLDDDGRQVVKLVKGVEVPQWTGHFHPHEFRHTAASLAIAAGADVKVVQAMLGHKSATMTLDLYGHLFPDRLDIVADAMQAARERSLVVVAA